jgi:hypothetical protein
MRTTIDQRKNLIIGRAEDGDRRWHAGARHTPRAAARDIVEPTDLNPTFWRHVNRPRP